MIIIAIEGVLAEPGRNWALSSATLSAGRALYNALSIDNRIVLFSSDPYPERTRAWLLKEHFKHFSEVHSPPIDWAESPIDWKVQKVRDLSTGPILFYIDTDPEAVRRVVGEGFAALLPIFPARFPGVGAHRQYTPWEDLVDTIEEQNLIRASRGLSEGG